MPRKIHNTPEVRQQLAEVLILADWDFGSAARLLGISRDAFVCRLQRLAERPRVPGPLNVSALLERSDSQ